MCDNKKFYKALLKEPYMKSQYSDMTFELGKTYRLPKNVNVKMYDYGFHYTDNIYLLPLWYSPGSYYIFEVLPGGNIEFDESEHKYCSEEITIIKQLDDNEIEKLYKENRINIIHNKNPYIRKAAVRLGRPDDLEVLKHDEHPSVKMEFIRMGYDIQISVYDMGQYIKRLHKEKYI